MEGEASPALGAASSSFELPRGTDPALGVAVPLGARAVKRASWTVKGPRFRQLRGHPSSGSASCSLYGRDRRDRELPDCRLVKARPTVSRNTSALNCSPVTGPESSRSGGGL